MKFLKLLLVFGVLCKTIDAQHGSVSEENVSFSVVRIWQSYNQKATCTCPIEDAPWKAGVEGHYNGCAKVLQTFRGKAFEIANVAVSSLGVFLEKLIYFTDSNSTLVQTGATSVLTSLSKCINLKNSRRGLNIIVEHEKVFLEIMEDFIDIIKTLKPQIGELTCSMTDAVGELGQILTKYMKDFIESCRLFQCRKKVDYKCALKALQKLMNTVALINETLLNECSGKTTQDVEEAVMILDWLYLYMAISVVGTYGCALDTLYNHKCYVSQTFQSATASFEYMLEEVTQAVCAVTFPFVNSITELFTTFVNITLTLNMALKSVFGLFGGVGITVGQITKNVLNGVTTVASVTKQQTNILKGVRRT